jgi:hypothetical protein
MLACVTASAEDQVVHVGVHADSEHLGMEAFLAMDGNPGTFWHSIWRPPDAVTPLPHEIVVDLGEPREITGFTYLPRTDNSKNGNIKDYEVYLSDNPDESKPLAKGTPIAKGTFAKKNGDNIVKFDAPVTGRYFRLRTLSNVTAQATWAGIAELTIHSEGAKFVGQSWALATGELQLPKIFGSHMVLQRDVPPVIWGWGTRGEEVTVALDGDNTATAQVGQNGAWKVTLKPVKADGKAHKLVVTGSARGGRKIELDDILIGDVWIGSGQSNMARSLAWSDGGAKAVKEANHPAIRLLSVARVRLAAPATDVKASWKVCSPETAGSFSAVLYHFGRRLREDVDVPLGLINASWGGSAIEPWLGGGVMYNGMIAPLVSSRILGVIWYQGETNVLTRTAAVYRPVWCRLCPGPVTGVVGSPGGEPQDSQDRHGRDDGPGSQHRRHPSAQQARCWQSARALGPGQNLRQGRPRPFGSVVQVDEGGGQQDPHFICPHWRRAKVARRQPTQGIPDRRRRRPVRAGHRDNR